VSGTYHFLNAAAITSRSLYGELLGKLVLGNGGHVHVCHVCLFRWRHSHLTHIYEPAGYVANGLRPLLAL